MTFKRSLLTSGKKDVAFEGLNIKQINNLNDPVLSRNGFDLYQSKGELVPQVKGKIRLNLPVTIRELFSLLLNKDCITFGNLFEYETPL